MDTNIVAAVDSVRAMARNADALAKVISVLDRLGDLENAEAAAAVRIGTLKSEIAAAVSALNDALAARDAAQSEAADITRAARVAAAATASAATSEAAGVVAAAESRAAGIAEASAQAQTEAQRDLAATQAALIAVDDAIAAKQKELSTIEQSIADIKAKLA